MNDHRHHRFIDPVVEIARRAGEAIMHVYRDEFRVDTKTDGSPITLADQASNRIILAGLRELDPSIPVLSEEAAQAPYAERRHWESFWLVDPLDGTKEFINRNGEFTVNIALIEAGRPVLGVVAAPAKALLYWGGRDLPAYCEQGGSGPRAITVRRYRGEAPKIVASRSHGGDKLEEFLRRVETRFGGRELVSMGSALKICVVAEGEADVYPRLGLTSEWDIAAAHCVLESAGGEMTTVEGEPIQYNKENILNPWFVAAGKADFSWTDLTRGLQDQ